MTPEALAALHARCFTMPRPWRMAEFQTLLADGAVVFTPGPRGFGMARVVLDEAELLTIATDPDHQGHGHGATLLAQLHKDVQARGATQIFLEVAATNLPAQALYRKLGYQPAGRRPNYYRTATGQTVDALLLRAALTAG